MKNYITLPVSVGYSAEVEKNQERIKKGKTKFGSLHKKSAESSKECLDAKGQNPEDFQEFKMNAC